MRENGAVRKDLQRVRELRKQGYSQAAIGEVIGRNRSYVQMLCRALDLPNLVTLRFASGKLTQADLLVLEQAQSEGTFAKVWERMLNGEPTPRRYGYRSKHQIQTALHAATDPTIRAALEWVLLKRDRLPG